MCLCVCTHNYVCIHVNAYTDIRPPTRTWESTSRLFKASRSSDGFFCHLSGCSALQCVVVCISVSQFVVTRFADQGMGSFAIFQVAVCFSVLQCVAVCYSVSQCVYRSSYRLFCHLSRCSVLQCVAECCRVLQCAAVAEQGMRSFVTFQIYHFSDVLQCVTVCCSMFQCVAMRVHNKVWTLLSPFRLQCVALHCTVLQCVLQHIVVCCSVFHCVTVCYSVLRCVAMQIKLWAFI